MLDRSGDWLCVEKIYDVPCIIKMELLDLLDLERRDGPNLFYFRLKLALLLFCFFLALGYPRLHVLDSRSCQCQ